jgi:DNA-binding MarR family transcriptional regulator
MEQQDIKTLKILEAFHKNPGQTQRDLSRKLKISLGMVNSFTKRLVRKGYFKVTTNPKNRLQYILTPKGLSEKTRLAYQYVLYSMHYYRFTRARLRSIFMKLSTANSARIYFFGISELAEIAFIALQETDLILAGIIDDDSDGLEFLGVPVLGLSRLKEIPIIDWVVITKLDKNEESIKALKKNGIDNNRIVDLRK